MADVLPGSRGAAAHHLRGAPAAPRAWGSQPARHCAAAVPATAASTARQRHSDLRTRTDLGFRTGLSLRTGLSPRSDISSSLKRGLSLGGGASVRQLPSRRRHFHRVPGWQHARGRKDGRWAEPRRGTVGLGGAGVQEVASGDAVSVTGVGGSQCNGPVAGMVVHSTAVPGTNPGGGSFSTPVVPHPPLREDHECLLRQHTAACAFE